MQYYIYADNYNSRETRYPEKPDQIADDNYYLSITYN